MIYLKKIYAANPGNYGTLANMNNFELIPQTEPAAGLHKELDQIIASLTEADTHAWERAHPD